MPLLLGLLAGVPVGLVSAAYTWVRREIFIPVLKEEGRMRGMGDRDMAIAMTLSFGVFPLLWAVLGSLVYPIVNSSQAFLIGAVATAVLASLANIPRRTKLFHEFFILNLISGVGLGLLIPLFLG